MDMSLVYWDSSYNMILAVNFAIVIALFTCLRFFSGMMAHLDPNKELLIKDNAAFGLSVASVTLSLTILLNSVMYGTMGGDLQSAATAVALFGAAPLVSDDAYRYVWDGRVQRFGLSPYETVPNDPALAYLHTDLTRRIDPTSAALPTIYPPAAELFFRSVTTLHESVTSMVV